MCDLGTCRVKKFQLITAYLPLEEESLEDSDSSTLFVDAAVVEALLEWLGMCGDADRLKGFGVPAEINNSTV